LRRYGLRNGHMTGAQSSAGCIGNRFRTALRTFWRAEDSGLSDTVGWRIGGS
jgi:hypothetical protein